MNGNVGTRDKKIMFIGDGCGIHANIGGTVKLPSIVNATVNADNETMDSSNNVNARHNLTYEETIHLLEQKIQVCQYSSM
jgi:hypothetical protein